ncbi:hypothetical protein C095_06070 [Fusobacterium necrophorum subsp. funduliforme B35]|uniref:Uncharacterized protein n=1 Tax=Fusobacterium necrophorum subsp. funduliforme B35 TaxID=1226633 RepID=A0A0B4EIL2_9FUSO|nr:hypothetical protein C095_06070 [Fusobacterium necrophorum subsp. funduliforme B35]
MKNDRKFLDIIKNACYIKMYCYNTDVFILREEK